MPNSVQLYQKTSNNSATTTIKHLSLYEHPRRPSTSETLTIFGLWSSKLEKLFLTGFFGRHFVFRTKNQRGGSFSCLNALKNKSLTLPGHFDRFKMVHVDSQIKDSSNSLRRRHSSEGVDAKFGSTLPKDFAVKCTRTNILTGKTMYG